MLVTMFARYADAERFPISAYLNIGMVFILSFSSIGLLGLDLAFTLRDREDGIGQKIYDTEVSILWNIVYWGSLVFGTIFSNFLTRYWQSGHFTVGRRIKHVLKVSASSDPSYFYLEPAKAHPYWSGSLRRPRCGCAWLPATPCGRSQVDSDDHVEHLQHDLPLFPDGFRPLQPAHLSLEVS